METTQIRQQICDCRKYENRTKAEYKKAEIRGQRRDLECRLDKSKAEMLNSNPWPRYDIGWNLE